MAACTGHGVAIWGALALGAACSGPPGAGRQLGDDLGGYRVAATELSNGCGAGALGSRPSFAFEIDLSRESSELFWGREASSRLDARLGFELLATMRVPIVAPSATNKGCAIGRADHITGTLRADTAGDVVGFSARMSYAFEPAPDTSCSLDDRILAGLPRLPCEMAYELEAERTRDPDPAQD
ncbi:MAG: hypothetical protein ABI895_00010 [Deltaproteobacteria bacterium]